MAEKLVPITRLGKFFGGEDYALDIGMGEEWLIGDMNFTVILYRIDRYKTKTDDVYGEVLEDGIQFLAPVELKGYVQVMAPTNKTVGNSRVELQEPGNMRFSIYQKTLDDMGVDIFMGDYFGYYESGNRFVGDRLLRFILQRFQGGVIEPRSEIGDCGFKRAAPINR